MGIQTDTKQVLLFIKDRPIVKSAKKNPIINRLTVDLRKISQAEMSVSSQSSTNVHQVNSSSVFYYLCVEYLSIHYTISNALLFSFFQDSNFFQSIIL